MSKNKTLLIWDSEQELPDSDKYKVLWQSYTVSDASKEISIPKLIEDNADELKAKYLALIYDLGETKVK